MQIGDAALVEPRGELLLGEARAAGGGDRAHVDQQLDAGLLQLVQHRLGRRLFIPDGEKAFCFAGHGGFRCWRGRSLQNAADVWYCAIVAIACGMADGPVVKICQVKWPASKEKIMVRFLAVLAWVAASLVTAQAQSAYPDHPVKIIVPIAPGGSYDLVGRQLADVLGRRLGQAFFVENKPGAGTVIGTQAAAQSEPDGYTLLIGGFPTWRSIRRCIRS